MRWKVLRREKDEDGETTTWLVSKDDDLAEPDDAQAKSPRNDAAEAKWDLAKKEMTG